MKFKKLSYFCCMLLPSISCDEIKENEFNINNVEYIEENISQKCDNDLSSYIAQCEAVLGEIPEISCDPENPAPGTKVSKIPVLYNGKLLGYDNSFLEERKNNENYLCDFPSIGGDFPCTIGSTLVQYQNENNPNVQWVALCRGAFYDVPQYNRFIGNGLIGANDLTGEMCFFFGQNPDPNEPYELPKLSSQKTTEDLQPWLPPKDMPGSCLSCHPNNDPWILTPWLMPNYMDSIINNENYPLDLPNHLTTNDIFAAKNIKLSKYKHIQPKYLPDDRTAWTEEEILNEEGNLSIKQYRAIGSSYVDNEAKGSIKPRTGIKPDSWNINFRDRLLLISNEESCANGCHSIGNEHFLDMAKDSLGIKYSNYLSPLMQKNSNSWMPTYQHQTSINQISLNNFTLPAITPCPIPKQIINAYIDEISCHEEENYADIKISWIYENNFGNVPNRKDVKFDVSINNKQQLNPSEKEGYSMKYDEGFYYENISSNSFKFSLEYFNDLTIYIRIQPKRLCFEECDNNLFSFAPFKELKIKTKEYCEQ